MPTKIVSVLKSLNLRLLLIASVGIALSVFAWHFSDQKLKRQAQIQFEQQSDPLINALKLRVKSLTLGLRGARTVPLMVSAELKPQHFRLYMAQRKLNEEFPGALGFGFIRRVEAADVASFVADQQLYRPEFTVKSLAPNSGAQFIIQYIEPADVNKKAIGLDIASESVRKAAALEAMRTGEMSMTAPLKLVQAGHQATGFLILLPYYLRPLEGVEYVSMADRQNSLIGWVYAPVLMTQLVAGLSDLVGQRIDFEIYSGAQIRPEALIYTGDASHVKTNSTTSPSYSRQVKIELGGQVWTVLLSSGAHFVKDLDSWLPITILLLGLLLTALVTSALANAARLKNRAQSLAEAMSLQAKQRELQLDAVLDSSPDVIVTADRHGTILSTNRTVERVLGYQQSDLLGKNVSVLMNEVILSNSPLLHEPPLQLGKDKPLQAQHADGHLIPIEVSLNQFEMERSLFLVLQVRDMSHRFASEEALRVNQRQLSMIVDSAGIGTWDLDLATNEAYYGGIWGEMLGLNTQELIPDASTWRDLVHPDELVLAEEALSLHLMGLTAVFDCEFRMRTVQNQWKWIHSVGRLYGRDASGKPLKVAGIHIDVDSRKRNELMLLERDKALAAATEEALSASRAKSDFLANMSHEIRTPMNAVIGFSTLLADTELSRTQREFVNAIQQSGDALLSLINDVLDLSKIEAGHLTLEQIEFDVRYLLEGSLNIVAEKAVKQGLDLACIIDPRVPQRLIGDPSRLRQIVLNLLSNAIKFTKRGEVVARLSVLPSESSESCLLRFSVKDTGLGMTLDVQKTLFRPFKQADSSTTRRFGGTGLGLSICRHLLNAMRGQIGVQSQLGCGAEFWFELSLPIATQLPLAVARPLPLQGQHVLVVDDFVANRELITLQLQVLGMVAVCFTSASEALLALGQAKHHFVLGLIDMQLPGMDGLQLARALQEQGAEAMVPLILLTSMAQPGLAAEARLAGYSAFLTKPIRQTQLLYVIEEALKMQHLPRSEHALVTAHHLAEQIAASKPYILLAEDNPMNQKVAVLMLEKLGCRVDVASNGLLAIEAVQRHSYDVLMMDCQMPEMDGFTATAAIRALPAPYCDVYIVALTANVFQSDIDRCYAMGMNDFVAKPIKIDEISYALQRGLSQSGRLSVLEFESSQGGVMTNVNTALQQELQDIERMFAELTQAVGMDMKDELLALFFPTLDECLTGLASSISAGDVTGIVSFSHKLKGAAGQLGATRMAAHSKAIEMAVKVNNMSGVSSEFAALQVLGQEVSEQLRVA